MGYIITGSAYNSYDRTPVVGATVTMADLGSSSVYTAESGTTGLFSISVPSGVYNFNITAPGKWYSNINPQPVSSDMSNFDFALLDIQTGMNFEFLTFWGSKPTDLDALLLTPACNASYKNRKCSYGSSTSTWAYDCRNGWGPESVLLRGASAGVYEFWVNLVQSSSSDTFSMNEARLPTAWISAPTNDPQHVKPAFVTVPTSKDPTLVWWRAVQLVVSGKRDSSFTFTFPNELYTSPPSSLAPPSSPPSTPPSPPPSTPPTTPSASTSTGSSSPTPPPPSPPSPPSSGFTGGVTPTPPSSDTSQSTVSSGQPSGTPTPSSNVGGYQLPYMSDGPAPENQAGCTAAELKYCQVEMGGCMKSSSNGTQSNCACFMTFGSCLERYECINGAKESFQTQCMDAGCEQSSCQSFATSDATKIIHSWVAIFLIVVSALSMTQ